MDKNALKQLAIQTAKKYGLPQDLVLKQIQLESGFNPNAKSSAGAVGIAQFKPATAKAYGLEEDQLTDPVASMEAYGKHMSELVSKYGDIGKALLAYNQGEGKNGSPQLQAYDNGDFSKIGKEGRFYLDTLGYGQKQNDKAIPETPESPASLPVQNGQPSQVAKEPEEDMFQTYKPDDTEEEKAPEEDVDKDSISYKLGKGLFDNDVVKGISSGVGAVKKAVYDPVAGALKQGTGAIDKSVNGVTKGISEGIDDFMVGAGMKTKEEVAKSKLENKDKKGFSFVDSLGVAADMMAGDKFENIGNQMSYRNPMDDPYLKNYLKQPRKRF